MAQPRMENVHGHWGKLIENFETSAKDFYVSVEAALDRRKIPGLSTSRIDWDEGGIISPKREYLRITGGRFSFDVCAAPFGTGYFFSSWLVKRPARFVLFFFALYLLAAGLTFTGLQKLMMVAFWTHVPPEVMSFSLLISVALAVLSLGIGFWLIAVAARLGWDDPEAAMLELPVIDLIYAHFFAPQTYYRLDTVSMFRSAAEAAVQEAIEGLLTAKGIRALTEDERKPIFRKFV